MYILPSVLLLSQSAWIRVSSQRVSAIKKKYVGGEGPRRLFTSRFSYTFYYSPTPEVVIPCHDVIMGEKSMPLPFPWNLVAIRLLLPQGNLEIL